MLPVLSQATSVGRLNVEPGRPDPGRPRPPPPRPASAPPAGAPRPPSAAPRPASGAPRPPPGDPDRTLIASGFRPRTRATRPSVSNLTTWLAASSTVQTLSCGSTRSPNAALNP